MAVSEGALRPAAPLNAPWTLRARDRHPSLKGPVIGGIPLAGPAVLAPMAGVCNLAFRLLCKEYGAALVCSEFISAKALAVGNQKTRGMLVLHEAERPVSIQIFGNNPQDVAAAASTVEEAGADILDFNMGCPVPKVIKAEAGAALMRVPERAQAIIQAMVQAVDIPVTVKMRAGWDDTSIDAVDLTRRFEDVGVAAVAVHGRTRSQGRSGCANWDVIAAVKRSVSIPVLGNGDVASPEQARAMLDHTGCDGVMIGRGALGNPWIFQRIHHYLATGELLPEPGLDQRAAMARRHLELLSTLKGEYTATREMRRHAPCYLKGFAGAASFRAQLVRCECVNEYEDVFAQILATPNCTADKLPSATALSGRGYDAQNRRVSRP